MEWGSWHCTGDRDQDHPHGKEMQKGKMAVWGGLTKSSEKKRSEKWSEVTQSCPTLCNPVDCSPSGSSAHGILQARILKWVAISFSRGSSWPRDRTQVSCIAGRRFNLWATRDECIRFKDSFDGRALYTVTWMDQKAFLQKKIAIYSLMSWLLF